MSGTQANGGTPSISIQDLQNILMVVDLATSRGAFRGIELSQVGQVYDKLSSFLQSVMPQQPQDTSGSQTSPQPVEQLGQPTMPPQMMQTPTPVMPMTPPFSPKVGM